LWSIPGAALTTSGVLQCFYHPAVTPDVRMYDACNVPAGLTDAVGVSCGCNFSAAVKTDGRLICWGSNICGQCELPPHLQCVVAVSCGSYHATAITHDGRVVCWGCNNHGQCDAPEDIVVLVEGLTILM
jgi:alpha-tubulin suppressor-like RCC1 family protein